MIAYFHHRSHITNHVCLTLDALIKPKDGPANTIGQTGEEKQAYGYTVHFASPLHTLKLNHNNRIFCNSSQTVIEVIETVLDQAKIVGFDYVLNLRGEYPTREFIVQYDESDYDFLLRIMARAGIFFRFEQEQDKVVLYLEDQVNTLPIMNGSGSLPYELQSSMTRDKETIFGFRTKAQLHTAHFKTIDYNDETPTLY